MSKIDEILEQLCPDGVEYRALADVFETRNGYTPSKKNSEYWTDGSVNWFRMEDIRANGHILSDSIQKVSHSAVKGGEPFAADSLIVATSATIGEHALVTVPFLCNQRFTCLTRKAEFVNKLDMKFFLYYADLLDKYCLEHTNNGGFASVSMTAFRDFPVAIPPLEIQQEIVRILDSFTKLELELELELELRKTQYDYYRNRLIDFAEDTSLLELGEVVFMKAGKHIAGSEIKDVQSQENPYPCYGGNGIRGYVSEFNNQGEKVLIGRQGALCGNICRVSGKFYATEHAVVTTCNEHILPAYAFHMLTAANLNQYKSQGAQPGLAVSNLKKIKIQVPSIEQQRHIANVLDQFSALTTSLTDGLPAEIQARHQQYEYYRDKLLDFPRKKTEA
ncbi:restriction endonuclease subunit S [Bifidobacterium sp. ESL0732]|uniref:restriction endonuclease subunit S n=1 Tax=Bifidobacterium sp. ESL0732 TaxID=2983222 RepID=UPI0023F7E742|nr:restriction endonuclease subunit S [Bifidobacterium sp. ESL0732]WEV64534.1 restriction endonuclease subunit S [Bifidobacterium sp. ESL0732]